jgi:hypothetical protein
MNGVIMTDEDFSKYDPKNLSATVSFTGEETYQCNLEQLMEDIKKHQSSGFFNDKTNCISVKLDTLQIP